MRHVNSMHEGGRTSLFSKLGMQDTDAFVRHQQGACFLLQQPDCCTYTALLHAAAQCELVV
jgi:hypothetical protein